MPLRQIHLKFDKVLKKNRIISKDTEGNSVHNRMDKQFKNYGVNHREKDYFHSVEGIRDFIDNMVNSLSTVSQKTATNYVRIAYGHLCLDYMTTKLKNKNGWSNDEINWDIVFQRTYNYYRYKKFHKKFYKYK